MKSYKIYNPKSGKGKNKNAVIDENSYMTKYSGDCKRFILQESEKHPDAHYTIYGGDGTINESVCAIIESGNNQTSTLSFVASGSGNDTVKSIPNSLGTEEGIFPLDVIKFNSSYCVNMINIGFDCNVVSSASKFKKKLKIAGKPSYILGVITEFFKPFGQNFNISAICENGDTFSFNGTCLLCAVCNGEWCGGSFHNSPASKMNDGVIELLIVKKMSRLSFLRLVGKYKNGTLFNENGDVSVPKFKNLVHYLRIKSMKISGLKHICSDGEITPCTHASINVIPNAIKYRI